MHIVTHRGWTQLALINSGSGTPIVCAYIYIYMYIKKYVMYIYMYIYIYVRASVQTEREREMGHIFECMYVYIYHINMYIYIYIYMYEKNYICNSKYIMYTCMEKTPNIHRDMGPMGTTGWLAPIQPIPRGRPPAEWGLRGPPCHGGCPPHVAPNVRIEVL